MKASESTSGAVAPLVVPDCLGNNGGGGFGFGPGAEAPVVPGRGGGGFGPDLGTHVVPCDGTASSSCGRLFGFGPASFAFGGGFGTDDGFGAEDGLGLSASGGGG